MYSARGISIGRRRTTRVRRWNLAPRAVLTRSVSQSVIASRTLSWAFSGLSSFRFLR